MNKKQKISSLIAEIQEVLRNGRRADRRHTMKLHPGRGSSLKKLNRVRRTDAGIRPETYLSKKQDERITHLYGRLHALSMNQA